MNVRQRIDALTIEKRAYINGNYVSAQDGATMMKQISADGSELSGIAACGERDIEAAVAAAQAAFPAWSAKSPVERKNILLRLADLKEDHL